MHEAVVALLRQDRPVELPVWRSFWDRLHDGGVRRGESVALLASLSTRMPDRRTLTGLLDSLAERGPAAAPCRSGAAVNIVGTGGGPRTFNVSTAAALVAGAMGVRVLKTGSRAYTGDLGSVDLLERLGVPLASSYEQAGACLDRHGVAFAGAFVYPAELALLARGVLPLDIRELGGFVNVLGPFLARLPVRAQLTGVAQPRWLPGLRQAAAHLARGTGRSVWLCVNGAGADELLSCRPNRVYAYGGVDEDDDAFVLDPARLGLRAGSVDELRQRGGDPVAYFREVLSGRCAPVARETVCLNAAALAVAGGVIVDWRAALDVARDVLEDGRALGLLDRLRSGVAADA